jgi:hypothetical protein
MTTTDLYRQITGDKETHHRTITAALEEESKARHATVAMYAAGMSDRKVGERTHKAHGTARGMLIRTMRAIFRSVHRLPRYHLVGREKGYTVSKTQPPQRQRTAAATPAGLPQLPHPRRESQDRRMTKPTKSRRTKELD